MKLDEKGAEALLGVEGGKEYDKNVLYDILNKLKIFVNESKKG